MNLLITLYCTVPSITGSYWALLNRIKRIIFSAFLRVSVLSLYFSLFFCNIVFVYIAVLCVYLFAFLLTIWRISFTLFGRVYDQTS